MTKPNFIINQAITSLVVGFIFAIGLGVSGMSQPANVIGFLRIVKDWNPSLMFVMLGAIPIHILAYLYIKKTSKPLFDIKYHYPTSQIIDRDLILGAAIFGIGWGIAGYCPGPAITAIPSGDPRLFLFLIAMSIGMLLKKKK